MAQTSGTAAKPITRKTFITPFHNDIYPALEECIARAPCRGQSVFITGAGSGIGKATALAFAKAQAGAIFIAGRTESSLLETVAELKQISPNAIIEHFILDIVDAEAVSEAFVEAKERAGKPLDILINNAGYLAFMDSTVTSSFDAMWQHFEVNVKGSMLVIRSFMENAVENGATVINVSSGAAVVDYAPGLAGYGASKLAMNKLLDYMHHEGEREVRLFNLHPGVVLTAMAKEGQSNTVDTAELPARFCVWLTSGEADFMKGRFAWTNWDITNLKAKEEEIVRDNLCILSYKGWDNTIL